MKHMLPKLWWLTLCLVGLTACGGGTEMSFDESGRWIAAFTPQRIDAGAIIRIQATDTLMACIDTLRPLKGVFRFSPTIKGYACYSQGGRYIDFRPASGAMKTGQNYRCDIDMAALTGVDSMARFTFEFYVEERLTKLSALNVYVDPKDASRVVIEGEIAFNREPLAASLESAALTCDQRDATAQICRTDNARRHTFRLQGVKRQQQDYRLAIRYNPSGEFAPSSAEVIVPGIRDFKLISATQFATAQPYIELEFSAPLATDQELDGLITMDKLELLRIERQGANVKVFYPQNAFPALTLRVSDLLRCRDGRYLLGEEECHFEQEVIPPAIEIPIRGNILPDGHNLTLPFRAVNLAAIDVEVVKIYADNVLAFLQQNDLDATDGLRRFGRLIYRKTIPLNRDKSLNLHQWQNFSIDLKNLFRQETGAIYNIRLCFRKSYSLYNRAQPDLFDLASGLTAEDRAVWDTPCSYIFRQAPDHDWDKFDWKDEDDPMKDSYYMCASRMPELNLAASNLGLIVKRGEMEQLWTSVTDIMTAQPLAGIRVVAYNYQMREIGSAYTNGQGFADFKVQGNPYVVTASNGVSTTFVDVNNGSQLSTSTFDVGGKRVKQGVKGYIYGERGVWRPGDEIHLSLMVEDKQHTLPKNHPVTVELYNPKDQLHDRRTLTENVDGIYVVHFKTDESSPTGHWSAHFKVGGQTFRHQVRIETIKPNRLKIDFKIPDVLHTGRPTNMGVEAHWLTGVTAHDLSTAVEMSLFRNPHPFKRYNDYTFENPTCNFKPEKYEIFVGKLDSLGSLTQTVTIPEVDEAPGLLQANIVVRVAEQSGDESITAQSVRYLPYDYYVGIALGDKSFRTDSDLSFPLVAVDAEGNLCGERKLEYKIYKLQWSWWWEGNASQLSRYVQSESDEMVASGIITTSNGRAKLPFRVNYPEWGRYLVFVRDIDGGHATGGVVLLDWPEWRGHADMSDPTASTMLPFALDKQCYEVGETATVYLPKVEGGRVLLSIENGSRVVERHWVATSATKETAYRLPVSKEMSPNFYVHATLLQPHARTANDLPIRMYGIESARVVDKRTKLHPEIIVAEEILPQQEFEIRVRERDNKPMSYTLAIVDEGLLDITGYKTPHPWEAMNAREQLGVKTWDMYDYVVGATTGKFTSILSIGGDEALRKALGKEKRYNPVVKFLGPFTLNKGTKVHRVTLPMYIGSVRVMVVAAHAGTYGQADKSVAVRSPLMLQPTLPRTLACGDRLQMPINVMAMDDTLGRVAVKVTVKGPLQVVGKTERSLTFTRPDDKMVYFELACDPKRSGQTEVTIKAEGAGQQVQQTLYIDVRNPMPVLTSSEHCLVAAGECRELTWNKRDDGSVNLEVASLPVINFSNAFDFVENYSHYCTEQLSARAMYMLYARRFLNTEERRRAEDALQKILKSIAARQSANGGFVYWPGDNQVQEWVTSMAGEVLTEARRQGFIVNNTAYEQWIAYQVEAARRYHHTTDRAADLVQAYRLYTLALAGRAHFPAMNKLRESTRLSRQALLRLAAAYTVAGRADAAQRLLAKEEVTSIRGDNQTFYSPMRDDAMALEAWVLTGHVDKAMIMARQISDRFSADKASTQEVAFVGVAMSRLADAVTNDTMQNKIVLQSGAEKPLTLRDIRGVEVHALNPQNGSVHVENQGTMAMYISLQCGCRPVATERLKAEDSGVTMQVSYTDLQGNDLAVAKLRQGTDFLAKITVKKGAEASESMALTFAVPSGWEIWNSRLVGQMRQSYNSYADIRDDRVCWYFALAANESRTFTLRLRAAYGGSFLLPPIICEDMYDAACRALQPNSRVVINR